MGHLLVGGVYLAGRDGSAADSGGGSSRGPGCSLGGDFLEDLRGQGCVILPFPSWG